MSDSSRLKNSEFSSALFEVMQQVNSGLAELELYEFRYALENLKPAEGWESVKTLEPADLEILIGEKKFFERIKLKPIKDGRIVLDEQIKRITQILFVGLVTQVYSPEWVKSLFYFDIRGFIFLIRTTYLNQKASEHFGGKPFKQFEVEQKKLDTFQEIGYRDFLQANQIIDENFIQLFSRLLRTKDFPLLVTLVGPSASGKTEIVERLTQKLTLENRNITTLEMDNFFKDRSFRDGKAMGKEVIHYELFQKSIDEILKGKKTFIPKYDFIQATSSHDLESNLRPGQDMLEIKPADIILLEGNFPFHIPEITPLIGFKIVYLTDDPVRLKRKWKRDIDYRKKYDPVYLCNRYFRTQYLRAEEIYRPMLEAADIFVDTSAAALWLKPELTGLLGD